MSVLIIDIKEQQHDTWPSHTNWLMDDVLWLGVDSEDHNVGEMRVSQMKIFICVFNKTDFSHHSAPYPSYK